MKIFSCNIGIPRRPWWSNINSKGLHSGGGIEMGETQKVTRKKRGRRIRPWVKASKASHQRPQGWMLKRDQYF
jgi:hypothetical protein